jgi:hypothetical protein
LQKIADFIESVKYRTSRIQLGDTIIFGNEITLATRYIGKQARYYQ